MRSKTRGKGRLGSGRSDRAMPGKRHGVIGQWSGAAFQVEAAP